MVIKKKTVKRGGVTTTTSTSSFKRPKGITVKKGTVTSGNNFNIATQGGGSRHVSSKKKNTGYLNVNSSGTGSSSATPNFNPNEGAKSINKQDFSPNASFEPSSSPLSASGTDSNPIFPDGSASGFTPEGTISAAKPGEEVTGLSKARFEAGETGRAFMEGFTGDQYRKEQDEAKFHETLAFVAGIMATIIPIPGLKALGKVPGLKALGKGAQAAASTGDDVVKSVSKLAPVIKDKKLASQLVSTAKNDRLIKRLVDKYVRGITNEIKTVVNPATGRITETLITKKNKLIPAIALTSAIGGAIGFYAWDGHLKVDTIAAGYQIAMRDARTNGNQEAYDMIDAAYNEFLDESWLDKAISFVPGFNVAKTAVIDGFKQAKTSKAAFDMMMNINEQTANDDAYWAEVDKRKLETTQAQSDIFLETQRINRLEEAAARSRGDRKSQRMWAEHNQKMAAAEIANAKLLSELWLEHDRLKQAQQIEEAYDSGFSNLGFGLL